MASARDQEAPSPGPGERQFLAMRELATMPEHFADFARTLHLDAGYRGALQMCMQYPTVDNFRELYRALRAAGEHYCIRRAAKEIRQEQLAAAELPLFGAAGAASPPERQ